MTLALGEDVLPDWGDGVLGACRKCLSRVALTVCAARALSVAEPRTVWEHFLDGSHGSGDIATEKGSAIC